MNDLERERRIAELQTIQRDDPREIIRRYCIITSNSSINQLPSGVSFWRMVETIVAHEMATDLSSSTTD